MDQRYAGGESGIEAALCGVWDVPIIFVSGDEATCREVTALLGPKVVAAPVKVGLGRYSARSLGHADACDLIEERVRQSVSSGDWPSWKVASPVTFTVELAATDRVADFRGDLASRSLARAKLSRAARPSGMCGTISGIAASASCYPCRISLAGGKEASLQQVADVVQ